jgi:hypothetical protein
MDISMMTANHLAEASKRGRGKAFQWTEHGAREAAARLLAATLVVAVAFAALELNTPRQRAGDAPAATGDVTASADRRSPR